MDSKDTLPSVYGQDGNQGDQFGTVLMHRVRSDVPSQIVEENVKWRPTEPLVCQALAIQGSDKKQERKK